MKKITHLLTITIMMCNSLSSIAMEQNTHLVIVPGQNGLGGQNVDTVLPYFADTPHLKHHVKTPSIIIDFGQNRCQSYLRQEMSTLNNNDKAIIHGSSQGTATTINYTAKNPEKIGALILEAVMLSGNSAISHTVSTQLPSISSLPVSYYWLPYAAKIAYLFYSPAGEQPIFNVDKLPTKLPIIILHHTKDPQLSHEDAQALYAFLKDTQKNENVYLMSKWSPWKEHVLLLQKTTDRANIQKIDAINAILEKHDLLPSIHNNALFSDVIKSGLDEVIASGELAKEDEKFLTNYGNNLINLTQYQPDVKPEWLAHFNTLLNKEKKIWYIDWGVKTAFYSLLAYIIYRTGLAEKLLNRIHSA